MSPNALPAPPLAQGQRVQRPHTRTFSLRLCLWLLVALAMVLVVVALVALVMLVVLVVLAVLVVLVYAL
eukprot:11521429-Alexandrium_andersonii.AAC.1